MPSADDIRNLIRNHTRRLQKLKEQAALHGVSVEPKIPLEIEDIEAKPEELQVDQYQQSGLENRDWDVPALYSF